MALTADEKAAIRDALGYPDTGTDPDFRLEGAMDSLSAAGETRVRTILDQIATADEALLSPEVRRGVKRADDIEFFGDGGRAMLQQRAHLVQRLANILGVQPNNTASGSGPLLRG